MDIKGKRALVTGGALRVGRAIALKLAGQGCAIALHYGRSKSEAAATANLVRGLGVDCSLHKADLSRASETLRLGRQVLRHRLGCQVLINNASVFPRVTLEQARPADFDLPYAVNLRAPALLTQVIGLALVGKRQTGRIVNIADVGGHLAWPGALPYSLSKAGLLQLTRLSAAALAPWVLVNSVSPGSVLMPANPTPAQRRLSERRSLLKRLGSPKEVADAVLLAVGSDFMTGADIRVDGGRSLA